MPKNVISLSDVERAVMTMAHVAFENEKYFGDLDGEMGDADFGKSLATGFHAIQAEFDKIDHSDIGVLLTKCGMIFAANVGGCSGPLWGTAFMRAGMASKGKTSLTLTDLVAMGRSAVQGMMARGSSSQGDKTLLDAIIPAIDKIEEVSKENPDNVLGALRSAAEAANAAIEGTRNWVAKRGRASYAGERTIGTLDPGVVAVARMASAILKEFESAEELGNCA
ncbi:MAG: dihydroxyacetone kinase subunit L [Acidobacteria bacterium]|nr:MAG: dihydroxyacetone kinase subunit L [Acidobacteriota bacterium]